ncbi:MAG: hypothetical protein IPL35_05615 [Sphingobacteriales bacterium]|nr:hypothetical protein [Sphingobacteriales bacterium]
MHIEADFCGNGNAADAAPLFEKEVMGQKVLFPQATNSLRSMQELLSKAGKYK